MSLRCSIVAAAALFLLTGCQTPHTTRTVVLVDVSKSISPDGMAVELAAIDSSVAQMGRGDQMVVIPISGNTAADVPGHMLRLIAPVRREAYDGDLARFRKDAHQSVQRCWKQWSDHQSSRTDILGALEVAEVELQPVGAHVATKLSVYSDFLEDEGEHRFASDVTLHEARAAIADANEVRAARHFELRSGVEVQLQSVPSMQLTNLSSERRRAVWAFWSAYFQGVADIKPVS